MRFMKTAGILPHIGYEALTFLQEKRKPSR